MVRLPEHRPGLMGILNVTPDSFSDGGVHLQAETAIEAGLRMVEQGADILDVGGESTRPGADPVSPDEELRRVIPVVEALAGQGCVVSIDTTKPDVAKLALEAGAMIVNDVTALRDPEMRAVCTHHRCTVCMMHMQGEPRTMQRNPSYPNGVVSEVREFLHHAAQEALKDGIERDRIWIDPGIGFGKTVRHNLEIVRSLGEFVSLGFPVLVGASRKTFIGKILGSEDEPLPTDQRLEGTLAVHVLAQTFGARILRAHDVQATRRAIELAAAVLSA
jgi:dihydropteroate synthase